MTREEAIEILSNTSFFGRSTDDIDTALDMAISALSALSENKGRTYGEVKNFYLNGLVETYKRMGYTVTEISITEKNSLSPTIYEFGEKGGDV